MRHIPFPHLSFLSLLLAAAPCALGDTVSLTPVADTFVDSAQPTKSYGAAGALNIAAHGLPAGEFQSLIRFDTSSAIAQFNTTFGAGHWSIDSCSLKLTAFDPLITFFNPQAAGSFSVRWIASDSWPEGTGTPNSPGTTGVTFNTLSTYLSASDEALGTFAFSGVTSGSFTYTLNLTPGFRADLAGGGAGGPVSFHLLAADSSIAYLSNSRSFTDVNAWPLLTISAIAAPPPCAADFNHADGLTVQDIFDFLAAWFAGTPTADFNHISGLNVQDIFDFLAAWFAGC